jgi:molybdopterin molybdotransferase
MNTAHHRIPVEAALELIAASMPRWSAERVALADALHAVLREPVIAERDQPPFDRVTMDGIAIASAGWQAGRRRFRVIGTQAAGAPALQVNSVEECVEVMTGGVLPIGTDSVVPVERLQREGDTAAVEAHYTLDLGQNIHPRGSDHRQGAALLPPGTRIGPAEMGILTIGGRANVAVTRSPRIAVISTGDELVEPGVPIRSYQIRCSNARAIEASLRRRGYSQVTRSTLRDEPELLRREIGRLHAQSDLVILSGGVSMGKFDHVPATLASLGVQPIFHKILQKPGLPMWFGRDAAGKVVFALPGNPVSSLVCLVRYALPGLDVAMGAAATAQPRVRLSAPVECRADLTYFVPVVRVHGEDGSVGAIPKPTNSSGDFVSLGGTDGFVELPRGQDVYPAGYVARFFAW